MEQDKDLTEVFSNSECESDVELITRDDTRSTETVNNHETRRSRTILESLNCLTTKRQYTLSQNGDSNSVKTQSSSPRDKLNLVYICFFMAGAGFLFPFNSFISAIDYFYSLYKDQFSAVSEIIPMTYLIVTLFASTLNLLLVERLPIILRISFGYIMFSIALFFVPMLDIGISNHTVGTGVSFYLMLASVVVVGLGSGFQQSSYYGLSSMLPPRYSQALLAGESVAGFLVAVNRIFTKLIFSERVGAIVFFGISLLFVWMCVGCFVYILRSHFVRYHIEKCRGKRGSVEQEMNSVGEIPISDETGSQDNGEVEDDQLLIPTQERHVTLWKKIGDAVRIRLVVISQIWKLMVTIFINYLITLLIFPGLISEIQYDIIGDWTPVILIALFNLTDLTAKWFALIKIRWSSTLLMLLGFLRLILIPIAILCVSPSPCNPVLAVGVMGWAVVLTTMLGLSNGYFGSVPMIKVSSEVKKEENRELAGSIMIWTLLLGLSAGSVLAYALTPLTKLDETCTLNSTCSVDFGCNETVS